MRLLFPWVRTLPMIMQRETSECGLACLAMLAGFHGKVMGLQYLRQLTGLSSQGASVRDLLEAGEKLQLRGRALRLEPSDLRQLKLPAVLHWDMDHFVILKHAKTGRLAIHDPAVGVKHYRSRDVENHFTGIAVEFSPDSQFQSQVHASAKAISLWQLLGESHGLGPALLQVLVLSILVQALALLAPMYLQLVIDQGITRGDMDLVFMLALLFGLLMLAKTLVSHMRGLLLLASTNQLGFQLVADAVHHLLRLPLAFFEKRELGDVVSRFSALENIKQLVTREMVTVVVDGLFSVITVVILLLYQPMLTVITITAVVLHSLVRVSTLTIEHHHRTQVVELQARQQTRFMENIRNINTIKINAMENEREHDWLGRYGQYVNGAFGLGNFQLRVASLESLILGIENILIIYFGSVLVSQNGLTLGQLMSFVFLKQHFLNSILAMIPKLAEMRLVKVELERVSDILQAPIEESRDQLSLHDPEVHGDIVIRDLEFRYPGSSRPVIDTFNAHIKAGQITAISGPSGCGKSTLLKLILGLEQADNGSIVIDGLMHEQRHGKHFRNRTTAILHDENLLAGTLAYNINLDLDPGNQARLEKACQQAGILEVIKSLPMGFASRIGEMGNPFSAGQTRRLLLARALYRQTRLLILDETLTHLGRGEAEKLLSMLRAEMKTVVIVSHDLEVIKQADQVISLTARAD